MKILFVLPRSAWPPHVGQARLAYYRAKELKGLGYSVDIFYISHRKTDEPEELREIFDRVVVYKMNAWDYIGSICKSLYRLLWTNTPLLVDALVPRAAEKKLEDLLSQTDYDYAHIYSIRGYSLAKLIEGNKIRCCLDLVDSMTLNFINKKRQAAGLSKYFVGLELERVRRFESSLRQSEYMRKYVVVSNADKQYIGGGSLVSANARCKDAVVVCPIGIKSEDFTYDDFKRKGESRRILFFGTLSYEPNHTAALWIIDRLAPQLSAEKMLANQFEVVIAGRSPSGYLRKRARSAGVTLIESPKYMEALIDSSFCVIAPMQSGSGQQFKVVESIVRYVPVVCTRRAADPLGLTDGKDVLVAETPEEFMKAICTLYNDSARRESIVVRGHQYVSQHFSWGKSAEILNTLYSGVEDKRMNKE